MSVGSVVEDREDVDLDNDTAIEVASSGVATVKRHSIRREHRFAYKFAKIGDLSVDLARNEKNGKHFVRHVSIDGEEHKPTQRFWTSLFAMYGFNKAFFEYFSHDEVFGRIAEKHKDHRLRFAVDVTDGNELLAISNPSKPIVTYDELRDMVADYGGSDLAYSNGVAESTHHPKSGGGQFSIGPDAFENRFLLQCPIDGYGMPSTFLSLLRLVCSNGAVGYARAFKQTMSLGRNDDSVTPTLARVLEGFGNDEGFDALRQRIEASQKSWASVSESDRLNRVLLKVYPTLALDKAPPSGTTMSRWSGGGYKIGAGDDSGVTQSALFRSYNQLTGDPTRLYGLANVDALSQKTQKRLPVNCSVYDLVNFATEIATHYAPPSSARALQAFVGDVLAGEYDMEGTKEKIKDFKDFHLDGKFQSGLTGSTGPADPSLN